MNQFQAGRIERVTMSTIETWLVINAEIQLLTRFPFARGFVVWDFPEADDPKRKDPEWDCRLLDTRRPIDKSPLSSEESF